MAGADELQGNLATYKEQLSQVETALSLEPDNEQLIKLKSDLQEVIELTETLVAQNEAAHTTAPPSYSEVTQSDTSLQSAPSYYWKSGDRCMAQWSKDNQYYPAAVDEILSDGTCSVIFEIYNQSEVTQVDSLKPYDEKRAKETRSRRDKAIAEREYKKQKNLKKKQRFKELAEQREGEKAKWQNFNSKLFSKTNKGKVKKSIFATSEHVKGKVGVGTCGISGKPMTSYSNVPKYHKQS